MIFGSSARVVDDRFVVKSKRQNLKDVEQDEVLYGKFINDRQVVAGDDDRN